MFDPWQQFTDLALGSKNVDPAHMTGTACLAGNHSPKLMGLGIMV